MVEPIFAKTDFVLLDGDPKCFDLQSAGSGETVHVQFCNNCGTKLWLSFERFPDAIGIYAGIFDDPCWFAVEPGTSKYIFLEAARADTIIPPGLPTYVEHAMNLDGEAQSATVLETPCSPDETRLSDSKSD